MALFVGGIRALLIQSAHPEVVAGVEQHLSYRTDPLGRLTRTSFYVTATTFGALPEVEEAVRMVRAVHGRVGELPSVLTVHNSHDGSTHRMCTRFATNAGSSVSMRATRRGP